MRLWESHCVRAPTILSSLFSKSKPSSEQLATTLSEQQRENLRKEISNLRTDSPKSNTPVYNSSCDIKEILNHQIDEDSIRARGFLKYRYNYQPSNDTEDAVFKAVKKILFDEVEGIADLSGFIFSNNDTKFKIISSLSEQFKHCPTNSRLMHIQSVKDVIDFYKEPVENITSYIKSVYSKWLARKKTKPRNIHMVEQAHRFHPEDVKAWHRGITAFPGSGGSVLGLRNKRLLRQFKPKSEWFDYEDQTFDYTRPDKNMPWDPEIARRMDRFNVL
ncbi:hypothetical protein DICVIV_09903 [Dictyocaulus viviparus]|uniref:Large ribosomal subunit protein mL50 n=1 Tax=Dictyocaulus viviparus TaxID=29172 RepID=A0A0D8XHH1_DICVI|nr:hypothetical protein DICVIV_09903 [Dictyocaulus viviparus]